MSGREASLPDAGSGLSFVVDSAGNTNDGSLFLPERPGVTMKHKTEKKRR